jgi:signal peptidase I
MPGVEACGRCGSPLRLATAVIDVHPPRAKQWQKRLRRLFPIGRTVSEARAVLNGARERTRDFVEGRDLPVPPSDILLRMPFAGWPHFHMGDKALGWAVLGLYLGTLLPGLVLIGSFIGSVLLGLAFSVHTSSSLSILFRYGGSALGRLRAGLFVLATLALGVYLPIGWAVSRVALPIAVNEGADPIAPGDVFLINRSAYYFSAPQPGDVVLYNSGGMRAAMPTGHGQIYVPAGERIDRVLAGPGSDVRWEYGKLFVNGVESSFRPLNPRAAPAVVVVQVPAGHYFILSTTLPYLDRRLPEDYWTTLGVVSARDIEGKVYLRTQPFSRWGRLH